MNFDAPSRGTGMPPAAPAGPALSEHPVLEPVPAGGMPDGSADSAEDRAWTGLPEDFDPMTAPGQAASAPESFPAVPDAQSKNIMADGLPGEPETFFGETDPGTARPAFDPAVVVEEPDPEPDAPVFNILAEFKGRPPEGAAGGSVLRPAKRLPKTFLPHSIRRRPAEGWMPGRIRLFPRPWPNSRTPWSKDFPKAGRPRPGIWIRWILPPRSNPGSRPETRSPRRTRPPPKSTPTRRESCARRGSSARSRCSPSPWIRIPRTPFETGCCTTRSHRPDTTIPRSGAAGSAQPSRPLPTGTRRAL